MKKLFFLCLMAFFVYDVNAQVFIGQSGTGGGGVTDGDKGDVDVTGGGTVWMVDTAVITGLKIAPSTVANSNLSTMPTLTLKGNNTGGTAAPLDLTVSQVNTMLGTTNSVSGAGNGVTGRFATWASNNTITSIDKYVINGGNVGFGINVPVARLDVLGETQATSGTTGAFLSTQTSNATSGTLNSNSLVGTFAAAAGSSNYRLLSIAYTINNSGAQTGTATGIFLNATQTTLNSMGHNLIDLQRDGVNRFKVDKDGITIASNTIISGADFQLPTSGNLLWSGSVRVTANGTNNIILLNNTLTDFGRLQFGGTTSSFPALKRSTTNFQVRLADDSAYSDMEVADEAYDATAWNGSLEVPTKNAIRDKIETLISGSISAGQVAVGSATNTISGSGNYIYSGGVLGLLSSVFSMSGNQTSTAWGLLGMQLRLQAATFTDNSTAASGTATNVVINSFGTPSVTASNSNVTGTNVATAYIASAVSAGANFTATNNWALWVDDAGSGGGAVRIDDEVVIGATSIDASAKLEIASTTGGVLMPRMTATQGSAISSPTNGLIIYVTDTNGTFTSVRFWGREAGAWVKL